MQELQEWMHQLINLWVYNQLPLRCKVEKVGAQMKELVEGQVACEIII